MNKRRKISIIKKGQDTDNKEERNNLTTSEGYVISHLVNETMLRHSNKTMS